MVDALVGSLIAVVATSALVLMIEAIDASSIPSANGLSFYNIRVVERVAAKRGIQDPGSLQDNVADWLSDQASMERPLK